MRNRHQPGEREIDFDAGLPAGWMAGFEGGSERAAAMRGKGRFCLP